MSELLRVEEISKRFGMYEALSNVSFTVQSGEILGVIGPNGAGKTTLMECIIGLLPSDNGAVYWQDRELPPVQRKEVIFYLPDNILPYAEQRVETVLLFFSKAYGAEKTALNRLIERLELAPMLKKRVNELSKGYRRRLLLAIGLLSPQDLLMLDEPFDGLDLRQTLSVMELLRETLSGHTMLLSIHQLTDAEKICDRFLLLDAGKIVGVGTLAQLQKQAGLNESSLEEVFLASV